MAVKIWIGKTVIDPALYDTYGDECGKRYSMVKGTRKDVAQALALVETRGWRVRIWYGSQSTGRADLDERNVVGYVGNSGGTWRIPLLYSRSNAKIGYALDTQRIIKIVTTRGNSLVWQHRSFDNGEFEFYHNGDEFDRRPWVVARRFASCVNHLGVTEPGYREDNVALFPTQFEAYRWIEFMVGRRMRR